MIRKSQYTSILNCSIIAQTWRINTRCFLKYLVMAYPSTHFPMLIQHHLLHPQLHLHQLIHPNPTLRSRYLARVVENTILNNIFALGSFPYHQNPMGDKRKSSIFKLSPMNSNLLFSPSGETWRTK